MLSGRHPQAQELRRDGRNKETEIGSTSKMKPSQARRARFGCHPGCDSALRILPVCPNALHNAAARGIGFAFASSYGVNGSALGSEAIRMRSSRSV
jgi:hypothetical protein